MKRSISLSCLFIIALLSFLKLEPAYATNNIIVSSDSYNSVQGQDGWWYQEWDGTKYVDLSWDPESGRWYSQTNPYTAVWDDGQHPSITDSVRKWKVPVSGVIRIQGNIAKSNIGGGDGVNAKIMKNGVQVWPESGWQHVAYNNDVGIHVDVSVSVTKGDSLYFIINKNGGYDFDATYWPININYIYPYEINYIYNSRNLLEEIRYPNGHLVKYSYDKNGNLIKVE